jgi:PhzF family phenazine biosynthesis protein
MAEALGVNERVFHRGLPLASAYTGLWSTFVPLVDAFVLDALEPDMDAIRTLSDELGVSGIHPYAPMGPDRFAARDFAPLVGIPEDPVTGSASGALIALLAQRGLIPRRGNLATGTCYQGHAMGQPGDVSVEVTLEHDRPSLIRVGGCAVVEREGRHDPRTSPQV